MQMVHIIVNQSVNLIPQSTTLTIVSNLLTSCALLLAALLYVACENTTEPGKKGLFAADEIARWEKQAAGIRIVRDSWGIPHIYGKTDADAVFGMLYTQCEDDFKRIELNYITAMGRMAEVKGEEQLYHDLRMRLFADTAVAKQLYTESPEWMRKLMEGFAAGINYYLYTHPDVKPQLITRFEPWMPLLFSEGSIGGDIETISVADLKAFYGDGQPVAAATTHERASWAAEPSGSNGFAIAPAKSASGNALLLINPHTSFFFRSEQHVVSEEGLNAYGAVTWGQFFIYQGFNEHCGWMHTSSRADAIDEYVETVVERDNGLYYKYGQEERPLRVTTLELAYDSAGNRKTKEFEVYHTHRGPVIRQQDGKWVSIRLMQEPLKALTQSYLRTKAATHEEFHSTMAIRTNSSNNTVYADDQGNIAYYHGNFIPVRNTAFDFSQPVDGSNPEVDWQGLHAVEETVRLFNPSVGWLQNCNSTPFTAAAEDSPSKENYPVYMAPDHENARGLHAVRVLKNEQDFTLDKLIAAAYDPYLTGFEALIPSLIKAYAGATPQNTALAGPIQTLKDWDLRYAETSVATSLAIFWAQALIRKVNEQGPLQLGQLALIRHLESETSGAMKLEALAEAVEKLHADFGSWQTPWGEINRFQRVEGAVSEPFNDSLPSIPIAYTSSMWGALSAYGSRAYPGTKKMYGTVGNSFVAVVEFGEKVKAKAIVTGGQSADPQSPHFNDQAEMYRQGQFRDVLFYREEIDKNLEKSYTPGK